MSSSSSAPHTRRSVVGAARARHPRTRTGVGNARAHSPRSQVMASSSSSFGSGGGSASGTTPTPPTPTGTDSTTATVDSSPDGGVPAVIERTHVFLQSFMQAYKLQNRPLNTRLAIDPKIREWEAFCNHVYPELPEDQRFLLNHENSYKFLLYQAFRPKKPQGGKKRSRVVLEEEDIEEEAQESPLVVIRGSRAAGFNPSTYDSVMEQFADHNTTIRMDSLDDLPHPENPVGFDTVNTYKAALITIHDVQKTNGQVERLPFSHAVWHNDHANLMGIVRQRKLKVSVSRFEEKMTKEGTPYTLVEKVPQIESILWNMGLGHAARSQFAALRSRHAFLMSYAGIMRYESLHERCLSELYSFQWRNDQDVHDILITMFQLPSGKFSLLAALFCFVFVVF